VRPHTAHQDVPPDPSVVEFAGLVAAREAGDLRAAKARIVALRTHGYAICCIEPRPRWGATR